MKKKGFTLVELLAVIAILAILVIIALPNVMGMFRTAKMNSFKTEIKDIYKAAEQQWMLDSMETTGEMTYGRVAKAPCGNGNKGQGLDLSGRTELDYMITINKGGKIIHFAATDGTYQYYFDGDASDYLTVDTLADSDAADTEGTSENVVYMISDITNDDGVLAIEVSDGACSSKFGD